MSLTNCLRHAGAAPSVVLLASTIAMGQVIDAPLEHELHPVWGGQNQAVHTTITADGQRIIIGTGGGSIRVSDPAVMGGAWRYADTPDNYCGTLLDIEFLDENVGFACGRGGYILKTTDGGQSWGLLKDPVLDPCDDLATVWTIHPISESILLVAGLWVAQFTVDGGANWHPLNLHGFDNPGGPHQYDGDPLVEGNFHFYALSIVGDLGDFRGAMCGEWEKPDGSRTGVVFFTDAGAGAGSGSGTHWRMVLDDAEPSAADPDVALPAGSPPGLMREPWGLAFEPTTEPDLAIGYVVGGVLGAGGRIYRTIDGGENWLHEDDIDSVPYGVSAEIGEALVGTYGGGIATRSPSGAWTHAVTDAREMIPGPLPGLPEPVLGTSVPINFVDSAAPGQYVVAGEFGTTMVTSDYGGSWTSDNPHSQALEDLYELRLWGLHAMASDPNRAFAVGQLGYMMDTIDGGDNWSISRIATGDLRAVEFRNANEGIAVGDPDPTGSLNIRYTRDGGATWSTPDVVSDVLADDPGVTGFKLRDVFLVGDHAGWAVGHRSAVGPSAIFYTRDDGRSWFKLGSPPPPDSDVLLTGVVFPEPTRGIAVGWSNQGVNGAQARAYVVEFDPSNGDLNWLPINVPHPIGNASRKLLGIDCVGSSLARTTAYAVGNDGMVLKWNGSELVDVPEVYDLDESSGDVIFRRVPIDLETVEISPSGGTVLIGGQYDIDLSNAAYFGRMLKLDATGWSSIRSNTSKNIVAMTLLSDDTGFVLGQGAQTDISSGIGHRLERCSGYSDDDVEASSFDNANSPASIILKFIGN